MPAPRDPRVLTLGMDASWTGWGWCLADQHGPVQAGHVALGPPQRRPSATKGNPDPQLQSTHRTARLRAYLDGPLAWVLADGQLLRGPTDPLVRVVVEIPPVAFKAGKASAYVGVGRLVGAIELWGCRPSLAYPWVQEPGAWRSWWGIAPTRKGRDGEACKADAITQVAARWGRRWVDPFPLGGSYTPSGAPRGVKLRKAGPRGDVAEAILLAVGSSRHPHEAPAGPRDSWPEAPTGLVVAP